MKIRSLESCAGGEFIGLNRRDWTIKKFNDYVIRIKSGVLPKYVNFYGAYGPNADFDLSEHGSTCSRAVLLRRRAHIEKWAKDNKFGTVIRLPTRQNKSYGKILAFVLVTDHVQLRKAWRAHYVLHGWG